MAQYRYVSVLEAQSDGKPPNDNIEKGQKILKAGKHDTDSIEYMTDDGSIDCVEYEQVAVFEAERRMSETEIHNFGKEQWFDD